jgi:thiamine pyrophosphate-dependent acetolactate synthase large subunit-like protein
MAELLRERGELVVVSGLGGTSWDVAACGDDPRNFYLWGGMGGAVPLALGLALAQPARRVLAVTGDGEMLMGLGALATVGAQAPRNLAIVVIDNERYGETGGQATHTAAGCDLVAIARGAGLRCAALITHFEQLTTLRTQVHAGPGPSFALCKVTPAVSPMVLPPRDGTLLRTRFRQALGVG